MKFVKIKNIGSGNFSSVWLVQIKYSKSKAEKKNKLIIGKYFKDSMYYKNECEILDKLPKSSVFINRLIFRKCPENTIFFPFFVDMGNLLEIKSCDPSSLSTQKIKTILFDILVTLYIIHRKNIFHLDIKLENVIYDKNFVPKINLNESSLTGSSTGSISQNVDFISPTIVAKKRIGRAYVIDWNLSKFLEKDGLITKKCGSPRYAPPEIYIENSSLGWAMDMWSFGVLAFGMLTGLFPFDDGSFYEIYKSMVKTVESGFIEYAMEDIERDFLLSILKLTPVHRLSAGEALLHPFFKEIL